MLQAVDFLSGVFIYGGLQLVGSGTFVVRLRLRLRPRRAPVDSKLRTVQCTRSQLSIEGTPAF